MMHTLYKTKEAFLDLFRYPIGQLESAAVDYDEYWKDKRGERLGILSKWQKKRADIILSFLKKSEESVSVVDVGCADGSVLNYLKNHTNINRVVGVDVSSAALVKARAQGVETILVGNNLKNSVTVIPEADYVLLLEVLEHMPDAEQFLREMLKKSTIGVFFSFPNTGYFLHRFRLLFGKFPLQWRIHPSEHLRFWTYADLKWWLKAQGYSNYVISVYEGIPFLNKIFPGFFGRGLFVYLPKLPNKV